MTGRLAQGLVLILVCLVVGGLVPASAAEPAVERTSPGGIRFVQVSIPDSPYQALAFAWADGTAASGEGREGVPAMGSRLVFSGAGDLREGALVEAWRDQLASPSLSPTATHLTGVVTVAAQRFDSAASLLRLSLTSPAFPERSLERLRTQLSDAARRGAASSSGQARRALMLAIHGDTPITRALLQQPDTIFKAVGRPDLERWLRAVAARDTLVVATAGPLPAEAAGSAIDILFSALPATSSAPPVQEPEAAARALTIVIEKDVPQSQILAGGPVVVAPGEDRLRLSMGLSVFGAGAQSRLFAALRERLGATYGASAGLSPLARSSGLLTIDAAVANDKVAAAVEAVRAEYARLRREGVTGRELEITRAARIAAFRQAASQPGQVAGGIRDTLASGLPLRDYETAEARLAAVTTAEVSRQLAERLPEALTVVVVTPSAAGLSADCVVKAPEEVLRCR